MKGRAMFLIPGMGFTSSRDSIAHSPLLAYQLTGLEGGKEDELFIIHSTCSSLSQGNFYEMRLNWGWG